ncbi:Transcriptional regulatory protein uhpA [Serratia quinivorans]|nr:Transcriptional regulatory protein uhpA [Serratia quinivorans]CAI2143342.1 Transcriptional regulatory protein uhpA [Serratia quinivorans]
MILHINGYQINKIMPEKSWHTDLVDDIHSGDMALVAMASHLRTQKVLERLSCIGVRVMLFLEVPGKKYGSVSWVRGSVSKRISSSLLMPIFETLHRHSGNTTKILTKREKEVIEKMLQGNSLKKISESMNVSIKTVYSHRRNSLKKIGLGRHATSFSYVGYQDYIVNENMKIIDY